MSEPTNSAGTAPMTEKPARPGLLIAIIVMAAFVMILNETTLSNALPDLMKEFSIGADTAQWLTTAFMLTMAVVIPMTGYFMARISSRVLYILALSLFTVGSVIATVAPEFWVLLVARIVQAAGTAVIMPMLMTSIVILVPLERRGAMMGVVGIVMAVGPAVGPTYAGVILEIAEWREIFGTMVILGFLALAIGGWQMRALTPTSRPPFDIPSAILSAVGFAAAIYGLSKLEELADGFPTQSVIFLIIGAIVLAAFFRRQSSLMKAQEAGQNVAPLMNITPLRSREYNLSLAMLLIGFCTLFGFIILMPIFGQQVLGLSALQTGLITLPGGVIQGIMAPLVGRVYDAKGTRPVIVPGAALLVVAMFLMTLLTEDTSIWFLVIVAVALNVGISMIMTPLMSNALSAVPEKLSSHGSSILSTLQQLAGAAGTALFVAIMGIGAAHSSATTVEGIPDPLGMVTDGVTMAFWFGVGLAAVALVMTLVFKIDVTRERRVTISEDAPAGA
ncbi:MDR family MFS transporter [Corynebacterium terpenotabidum]|uniref:Lincomycin resistance protein n=1 Tax=Corynebacterium terpenotabidum Y-11 TaxID=1200352 RepID=S4XHD2_9CORY|nr:MDR family MFS transporter [Corynebacterium terpenotabidum]AGP31984.1 lincomycin resistance protein [Corynebacterium terpenotabidum Y-11]